MIKTRDDQSIKQHILERIFQTEEWPDNGEARLQLIMVAFREWGIK